jgi:putative nucleotidyltransferase with HDIG domain
MGIAVPVRPPSVQGCQIMKSDLSVFAGPTKGAAHAVARFLDSVPSLPVSPKLVTELLALFKEPDREVDKVVQLISYEPSLTAELLRRSNSVGFAGDQPAADLFEAVVRLGFYEVYCLVTAMFAAGTKTLLRTGRCLDVEETWEHSVMTAVAASVVAGEVGESRPVCFTAGLLHDIGKLVLASTESDKYARVLGSVKGHESLRISAERAAFGTDHAELGGELMARWNLPEEVAAAVRYHHNFAAAGSFEGFAGIVQLADMIALDLAEARPPPEGLPPVAGCPLQLLGFGHDDFGRLAFLSAHELEKVRELLEL